MPTEPSIALRIGILTGGASSRMGQPKGGVQDAQGRRVVDRLVELAAAHGEVVLVGRHGYGLSLPRLDDRPGAPGPIGGLCALLAAPQPRVIALSVDLGALDADTLAALVAHPSDAAVVAGARAATGPLEPFFARYDVARCRAAFEADAHGSPQRILHALGATRFVPARPSALEDWDTPEDVLRHGGRVPPHRPGAGGGATSGG